MKKVLFFLLVFLSKNLHSQNLHLKLDIFPETGIGFEYNFNNQHTLNFQTHILYNYQAMYYSANGNRKTTMSNLLLPWRSNLHYRYYYNVNKREALQKNTAHNSANYFFAGIYSYSLLYKYDFFKNEKVNLPNPISYLHFPIVLGWGLQRVYKNNLYIDFGLGLKLMPNMISQVGKPDFAPYVSFKFGYIIPYNTSKKK